VNDHNSISHAGLLQPSNQTAVSAAQYSVAELAEIYNQTRVDYIVPMPMNTRRMEEYIRRYDVMLDASFVALNLANEPTGIGMLALRDSRAWITRLGVIPERRGYKTGRLLMDKLMVEACNRGVNFIQLEVIKGNIPAQELFLSYDFEVTRELIVIRRPPTSTAELKLLDPSSNFTPITDAEIIDLLSNHQSDASWVEEPRSVLQSGSIKGFRLSDGGSYAGGWIIFHHSAFQIEHVVIGGVEPDDTDAVCDLLTRLQRQFPKHDTKVENIPADSPLWYAYKRMKFMETFRRLEMVCRF
jgi:ribosomal protein S18 acetylase RimI-like enzyme